MSDKISLADAIEKGGGEIYHQPIDHIKEYLETQGFEHLVGEGETNGWQCDFWEYFKDKDGNKWCLSGSLWYDDFKLYKS